MSELIVALDFPSTREALDMVGALGDEADFYKVGLELYTRSGPDVVAELVGGGKRVFLDLKLHDIPNTVRGAVAAAADLGVSLLTVHGSGGRAMLEAARAQASGAVRLLSVTVLTSLSETEIGEVWGREVPALSDEVGRLADLAREVGMDGVVASPLETSWLRSRLGSDMLIVTPGIRPRGGDRGDQKRVATAFEAVRSGADYLVVGRSITRAPDPRLALRSLLDEMEAAGASGA